MNKASLVSEFKSGFCPKDSRTTMISDDKRVFDENSRGRIFDEEIEDDITENMSAEDELQMYRKQFRNLSAYLQSAIEQERIYISREIHDELGQMLTALRMDLFWIKNKMPKNSISLIEKAESMLQMVDAGSKVVQRIAAKLRPMLLDDLGLTAAIELQIEEFQNRTGITCELALDLEDILCDQETSTAIYRILQEALTNVNRHSNATQVTVSLRELDDIIELQVRDNGKGITREQISNDKSFGIMGIKERARLLQGEVDIMGVHGRGTTLTVRIP